MSEGLIDSIFLGILSIFIGISRMLPIIILVPFFATRELKGMLRYGIAISLSLIQTPVIFNQIIGMDISIIMFTIFTIKEVIIGTLLGVILAMPFWLFDSVGALFDNQRGALIGGQFNPLLSGASSPLGHILEQCSIIVLITVIGSPTLLKVIWESYALWPALKFIPWNVNESISIWTSLVGGKFVSLVLYASPMIVTLLFIEFTMALLGLYSPQMQVFILSMPVKCLVGLTILVLYLTTLFGFMGEELTMLGENILLFKFQVIKDG